MQEKVSEKYIAKIADLYRSSDKDLDKMRGGADMIEAALKRFAWGDVAAAVDWYYTHKNDKTRPTIAAICAILNTWVWERKIEQIPDEIEVRGYALPRTRIFSIAEPFDKLVGVLVSCGLIRNRDGEIRATHSLIDDTGEPVLNPMQVLRWQVLRARNLRPDIFIKFSHATFLEQLAVALQNKLITIRVRDWGEYAANKRMEVR